MSMETTPTLSKHKSRRVGRSLQGFILRSFLLVVVILSGILTGLGAITGFREVRQTAVNRLEIVANLKQQQIERWLDERGADIAVISVNPVLLNNLKAITEQEPTGQAYRQAYSDLSIQLTDVLSRKLAFSELFLIDPITGVTLVSTDLLQEGKSNKNNNYFEQGKLGVYYQSSAISDSKADRTTILIATPVLDPITGELLAVLAARANLLDLGDVINEMGGLEETGETYLVNPEQEVVSSSRNQNTQGQQVQSEGIEAVLNRQNGSATYDNYAGVEVTGAYRWLPRLELGLLVEQEHSAVLQPAWQMVSRDLGATLIVLLPVIGLSIVLSRMIVRPLTSLTQTATAIAGGNLNQQIEIARDDEIGDLAQAFGTMTNRLRMLFEGLEGQVEARTRRLETIAALGEHLSAILNLETLLAEVVNQIQQNFDYYHAHIYLLDDNGQNLVVSEGTGEAGARLKARGHSIPLDAPTSLVARSARCGEVVRVDNVREAPDWLPNLLLPHTYSEMAVPIIIEEQVVGVLDVQQDEVSGLDESDANLLRSLANQVAVAIRNARLFEEVETALAQVQGIQEKYVSQAWEKHRIVRHGATRYHYVQPGAPTLARSTQTAARQKALAEARPIISKINGAADSKVELQPDTAATPPSIVSPIVLRDKIIGALQLHPASKDQTWSEDDIAIVEAVVNQLAQTAENLRLFEETRERAGREQAIREITDKLRVASSLDSLLQVAARELGQRLEVPHTVLEFGIDTQTQHSAD